VAEEYGFTDTDGRIPRFEYSFAGSPQG
jgi:hypothetical protein